MSFAILAEAVSLSCLPDSDCQLVSGINEAEPRDVAEIIPQSYCLRVCLQRLGTKQGNSTTVHFLVLRIVLPKMAPSVETTEAEARIRAAVRHLPGLDVLSFFGGYIQLRFRGDLGVLAGAVSRTELAATTYAVTTCMDFLPKSCTSSDSSLCTPFPRSPARGCAGGKPKASPHAQYSNPSCPWL